MKPVLYEIEYDGPGRLSTMARPRGGQWLDSEMRALSRSGVDVLVCLLTVDELRELDLMEEEEAAGRAGLEFVHVPIPDMSVPADGELDPILGRLVDRLNSDGHIVAHCWAGIGRSSLLAASVLVTAGHDHEPVWRRIAAARGRHVPGTPEQRRWVANVQHGSAG